MPQKVNILRERKSYSCLRLFLHPQIEKFRELLDEEGHHVEDNFRHVQPLNGRLVSRNEKKQ